MTIPEAAVWAIFFLPVASFVLISFIIRPFLDPRFPWAHKLSGHVTVLSLTVALALSAWAWQSTLGLEAPLGWEPHTWLTIGALDISLGILMNPLTAIMLVVVTGVSLMVQVYSQGYMRDDPGYSRYFAFMSLFTASMLGLVMARNVIQLYVFWELVGLSSYLLIGFWYHRPAAAAAAKKAFIVTRVGDFGFLLAILYLFFHRGDFAAGLNVFDIQDIHTAVAAGALGGMVVTWLAIGIFAGAVGKSAQFPLHTWLPDAMEGPTPVSALIHAATMVAAGVFLVTRFFPLFEASATAMNSVAVIGAFTALFAASMGLVMNDIKRVLAYSTISQLGFMMLALGVGAPGVAIFHLFNHAFFKALLFLGAGSVGHATGTFDMRYMGGLRRAMPWTYVTFVIAALSIAGIFPLSGFWSKDEILVEAFDRGGIIGPVVLGMGLVAAFMTALYMFRAIIMTFHGRFKGGVEAEEAAQGSGQPGGEHRVHLAESPAVMVVPLVVLAVPSVVSGFLANPLNNAWGLGLVPAHWIAEFLGTKAATFNVGLAAYASVLAAMGILFAYAVYQARRPAPEEIGRAFGPTYTLVARKYYMDELYEDVVVTRSFYRRMCGLLDWIDRAFVDGIVDFLAWFSRNIGRVIARLQTGQVQSYGVGISVGILVILVVYLIWG